MLDTIEYNAFLLFKSLNLELCKILYDIFQILINFALNNFSCFIWNIYDLSYGARIFGKHKLFHVKHRFERTSFIWNILQGKNGLNFNALSGFFVKNGENRIKNHAFQKNLLKILVFLLSLWYDRKWKEQNYRQVFLGLLFCFALFRIACLMRGKGCFDFFD